MRRLAKGVLSPVLLEDLGMTLISPLEDGPASYEHWLEKPDSLYVIANAFNLCVILIAQLGSTTMLPLYSYLDRPGGTLVIGLLTEQQHFIQESAIGQIRIRRGLQIGMRGLLEIETLPTLIASSISSRSNSQDIISNRTCNVMGAAVGNRTPQGSRPDSESLDECGGEIKACNHLCTEMEVEQVYWSM
ncbi:hypothetical protein M9H77_17406 [Catharanthus roseus]|uniref:Uncharacterized protein n=1 Tax=Catharanthus roseus TaxID=4058 RepID=A0ACC0B4W2_CATRO|nr:hypothetical protein M9H77_17406 [Catharanthus roseus]